MRVVAVTGMPGAGKGVFAEVAAERDWPVLRMGDLVRERTKDLGYHVDPKHVARTATALRRERGPGAWAEVMVPRLQRLASRGADVVLVDGIRNAEEVDVYRSTFGDDFSLIAVHAPQELRHDRLIERARADDLTDREWLRARDERELGYGLKEAIERADHDLNNVDTLDAFRRHVEELLDRLEAGDNGT